MHSFAKYIPISLVIVSVVMACYLSNRPKGPVATKKLFLYMAIYIVVWAYLCFRQYPAHIFIE